MLYVLIVLAIIVFMIGLFVAGTGIEDKRRFSIICLVVGVVVMGLSTFGIIKVLDKIDYYEEKTETVKIVSLQDNSQVEGNGGGGFLHVYITIGTSGMYTYYYQLDDGGYKQGRIDADYTIIYEEDNCEMPRVETYTTFNQNNWSKFWTKVLVFSNKDGKEKSKRYEIHVPKGTVVQEFNLDAET